MSYTCILEIEFGYQNFFSFPFIIIIIILLETKFINFIE